MTAVKNAPIRAPTATKATPMIYGRADPRFGAVVVVIVDANRGGMVRERIGDRARANLGRKRADALN